MDMMKPWVQQMNILGKLTKDEQSPEPPKGQLYKPMDHQMRFAG